MQMQAAKSMPAGNSAAQNPAAQMAAANP